MDLAKASTQNTNGQIYTFITRDPILSNKWSSQIASRNMLRIFPSCIFASINSQFALDLVSITRRAVVFRDLDLKIKKKTEKKHLGATTFAPKSFETKIWLQISTSTLFVFRSKTPIIRSDIRTLGCIIVHQNSTENTQINCNKSKEKLQKYQISTWELLCVPCAPKSPEAGIRVSNFCSQVIILQIRRPYYSQFV